MTHLKTRIIFISIILIPFSIWLLQSASASGNDNDINKLKEQLYSFDDPKITVQDLAFYLVTHNYDAKPTSDYVEVDLSGTIYKLVPNGNKAGLCDISPFIP
ncbi:MAG: hypothetical protein PHQ34_14630 [Methanothrix sp.]|nr:hypothetical protein [Methanothrix sp.]